MVVSFLLLTMAAPAAAQEPPKKPENPVGPVAYHGWQFDAKKEFTEGAEPQSERADYDGPPLGLRFTYIGRKAAEPTMGVDKQGRAFYAAADFDSAIGQARTEVWRSIDDNRSWHEVTPNVAGEDIPPTTLDPYVYVDPITHRVFGIELEGLAASYLSYSDDGGETWEPSAISAPGVNDHQTFFSGPPPKGNPFISTMAKSVSYYCVNALTYVACSYSDDGGQTFQPTAEQVTPGCVGCQTGHGIVDPDGRAIIPKGRISGVEVPEEFRPSVIISDNGGMSWHEHFVADAPFSSSRHTAVATDKAGNLYYVWYDDKHKLPYLAISRDHGQTWGKPIMVAPPGVHDTNFPMVAAGEAGRVAISFPGSSVNQPDDETRPWHAWVAVSTNALDEKPLFVAAPANDVKDPIHRGTCDNRCAGMYDFLDLQVSPKDGTAWATFTDTCTKEDKCTTERKPDLATDAQGVAVSQVSGPRLVGPPLGESAKRASSGAPAPAPAPSPPAATPSAPLPRDTVKPRVRSMRVTRTRTRRPRVQWRLSEPGSVTVTLRRGKRRVARIQSGRPSPRGSLPLNRLRPGRYRLTLVPVDAAGNRGPAKTIVVRIRRR